MEWGIYCENFVMIGLTADAGDHFKNRAAIFLVPSTLYIYHCIRDETHFMHNCVNEKQVIKSLSVKLPAGPVLETVVDLVGAHVVDSQRVALVMLVKEGIARYTGYCQVHRILPGTPDIARYTGYCQVHRTLLSSAQVHRLLRRTSVLSGTVGLA